MGRKGAEILTERDVAISARDGGSRFYFAVGGDFPLALLPPDEGLIVADRFGGEIVREAALRPLERGPAQGHAAALCAPGCDRLHALSTATSEKHANPQ